MNDSIHTIRRARVVREPNVRQVGDKTLVTIAVAENPIGEKAKNRYETMFIEGTFSGREGERAAGLAKGAIVGFYGSMGLRTYDKKDGSKGLSFEVPYATGLIIYDSAAPNSAEAASGAGPFDF